MAVGMAVLDVIQKEELVQHAKRTGDKFLAELERLEKKHKCIGNVR